MKTTNVKDIVTTICGVLILISGSLVAAESQGVVLPTWASSSAKIAGVVAGSVLAYFTGKNPDGTTKTSEQINAQQNPKV